MRMRPMAGRDYPSDGRILAARTRHAGENADADEDDRPYGDVEMRHAGNNKRPCHAGDKNYKTNDVDRKRHANLLCWSTCSFGEQIPSLLPAAIGGESWD